MPPAERRLQSKQFGGIFAIPSSETKSSLLLTYKGLDAKNPDRSGFLSKYQEQSDIDFELIAISVDEGIKGYRSSGLDAAVNNCKLLDIELVETSFFNTFNYSFLCNCIYVFYLFKQNKLNL